MLNGKFYTGLPPAMIERNTSTQHNRMQSSIFWPDDTKVDSAIETRVKRRNSFQITQNERPQLRMQSSVIGIGSGGGDGDVNTRQMFQKEFSKSSIEFLDNLCDETKPRKPLLLRGSRSAAREVTPKPTALSPQLPEDVVNAGYNTTAQKKQAFTSKIEFYDYAGEELNNRNLNLRRTKMDMNDKKEMERNTKNSPKLQVKNNMRNLGANEKLYPTELTRGRSGQEREVEKPKFRNDIAATEKNNMREDVEEREPERFVVRELDEECEDAQVDRKSVRPPANRLRDQHMRDSDYLDSRRTVSPEYGYRREQRLREVYEDDYEVPDFAPHKRYGVPVRRANSVGRFTSPPKRILKHTIRERRYHDEYPNDGYRSAEGSRANDRYRDHELYDHKEYNEPLNADEDYIDGRMRNIRIRTSPRKHVTYSDDTYSPHEDEMSNQSRSGAQTRNRALPNMRRTGSNQQRQRQQQQEPLRRYNSEMDLMEDVNNEMAMEETFMENDIHDNGSAAAAKTTATTKKLNIADSSSNYNNNTNNSNNNNNRNSKSERAENVVNKTSIYNNNANTNKHINTTSRLNNQTIASAARKITPKITAITAKQNTDDSPASEAVGGSGGMRKHLRSSLCLHNGEIVASDDGGGETSTAPTRNARSMATRQRISVGLPD